MDLLMQKEIERDSQKEMPKDLRRDLLKVKLMRLETVKVTPKD